MRNRRRYFAYSCENVDLILRAIRLNKCSNTPKQRLDVLVVITHSHVEFPCVVQRNVPQGHHTGIQIARVPGSFADRYYASILKEQLVRGVGKAAACIPRVELP